MGEQEEEWGRQREAVADCRSSGSPPWLVLGVQGEWLLGQGEKGLVCSNRSRLMGEVELKAWIKQKTKANMWKEENGQGRC